jgi:uncharacterized membrane protein YczE
MEYILKKDKMHLRLGYFSFSLLLCAVGISMIIKANIGVDPWNMFFMGITKTFKITLGSSVMIIYALLTSIAFFLGTKPYIATVLDILAFGLILDIVNKYNFAPQPENNYISVLYLILGLLVLSIAVGIYLKASIGAGPQMLFVISIVRKTNLSIGLIKTITDLAVLIIGLLLGIKIGIGTVVMALSFGYMIDFFYKRIKLFGL